MLPTCASPTAKAGVVVETPGVVDGNGDVAEGEIDDTPSVVDGVVGEISAYPGNE